MCADVSGGNGEKDTKTPKDRFFLVHISFFLMGLAIFIPYNFFATANEYWMYKFRDTSLESGNSGNRTWLQSHFSAGISLSGSFPSLAATILGKMFLHRFDLRNRTIFGYLVLIIPFGLTTACVYINTDSWQLGFFVFTLMLNAILYAGYALNSINHYESISKFPHSVLGAHIAGQGLTGICNSLLQIGSLAIGTSTLGSAKIYFYIGTFVLVSVLALFISIQNVPYYEFYNKKEITLKRDTVQELWDAFKKVWKLGVMFEFSVIAQVILHPSITSLVVSEYEGSGQWSDVYFVPVITFLLNNVLEFSGRIFASKISRKINGTFVTIFSFLRMSIFIFLIMFCNAQPRHHLAVLFPHDYQYIIFIGLFAFTGGFIYSVTFTSISNYFPPEKLNTGYSAVLLFTSFCLTFTSIGSFFTVNIL